MDTGNWSFYIQRGCEESVNKFITAVYKNPLINSANERQIKECIYTDLSL